jgi:hypothetical protein
MPEPDWIKVARAAKDVLGYSYSKIAKHVGVPRQTVRYWLNREHARATKKRWYQENREQRCAHNRERYRALHPGRDYTHGYWRNRRDEARQQARKEGVPPEVIYKRWDVE